MPISRAAGIVALAACAKFCSAPGQSFFIAVFVDHLIAGTSVTRTGFAVMYGLATVFSAATVLGVGRAVDRRGVAPVWASVALGLSAGCLVLSLATGPALVFLALCLMRGFGQGSFPLLGTVLVASSFEAARGRALSLSSQGIAVATATLPALCVVLIAAVGWRPTLQIVAATLALVVVPLSLLARSGRRRPALAQPRPAALRETLRRPGVRSLLLIFAVPPLVTTAIVVNAVSVLGEIGLGSGEAAGAIGVMALSAVGGALIGGLLVDRFAPRVVLAAMGATLVASTVLMLAKLPVAAYAGFVALGLAGGLYTTANGSLWAQTYGTEGLGRLQSLASSGQILGAALGPLPLALSLSLGGSYAPGLALLAALAGAGLLGGWLWASRAARRDATPGTQLLRPRRSPAGSSAAA
ncbi:MAG: MFS transporter [Solirubrobacterales bacterium]